MESTGLNMGWGALAAVGCGLGTAAIGAVIAIGGSAGVLAVFAACFIAMIAAGD